MLPFLLSGKSYSITEVKKGAIIEDKDCLQCDNCIETCPQNAISCENCWNDGF